MSLVLPSRTVTEGLVKDRLWRQSKGFHEAPRAFLSYLLMVATLFHIHVLMNLETFVEYQHLIRLQMGCFLATCGIKGEDILHYNSKT